MENDFLKKGGFHLMDNFHEEVVMKDKTTMDSLLYVLSYIAMIVFGILALFMLMNILPLLLSGQFAMAIAPAILLVAFGGLAYLAYVTRNKQSTEYEYTFTNGELDVAAVIMNNKRKKLLSANAKEFESIAPVSDDSYKRLANSMKDMKVYKAFRNNDVDRLYYGLFNHDGVRSILLFEPSEELLNMFKAYIPRNIKVKG
ncbi:DUF6106 family protein [Mahella australiensis]|uniref:Uncharacterized protein n=1 Tax=Mahella australiensis (strain DSM 15567 / CIP 107919 / 50-1 BON) TaxID=697281 RepID=F4A043_MAHA5|nr:DUF6106 family protein [Mahella australiensis]AEE96877.1 hypothetical protein Mahau_1696 [Mahella australiensis 50-1 BON]